MEIINLFYFILIVAAYVVQCNCFKESIDETMKYCSTQAPTFKIDAFRI